MDVLEVDAGVEALKARCLKNLERGIIGDPEDSDALAALLRTCVTVEGVERWTRTVARWEYATRAVPVWCDWALEFEATRN